MATLSITAASCLTSTSPLIGQGTAGAALTAGKAIYKKAADGLYYPADNTTAAKAKVAGIALHSAAANQPINYQYGGSITIGATTAAGTVYVLSADADTGGICPLADLASTNYATLIGVGTSTTVIQLSIAPSGVAVP